MVRPIVSDDIYNFDFASDPQIAPDGSRVLYVKHNILKEEDQYKSSIWLTGDGIEDQCIIESEQNDDFPRWSPDGQQLLFLSTRNGKKEVFLSDSQFEDIKLLIAMDESISFPVWSPDGRKIAFFANKRVKELSEVNHYTSVKRNDEIIWKAFDLGMKKHLFAFDLETGKIDQLTPDDFYLQNPGFGSIIRAGWSNDSQKIAFVSTLQDEENRELYPWKSDIYVVDLAGNVNGIKNVVSTAAKPVWSKDDKEIYYYGHFNELHRATTQRLCKVNVETGTVTVLSEHFDFSMDYYTLSDFASLGYSESYPKIIDNDIYFLAGNKGKTSIFKMDLESREVTCVVGGKRNIFGFSFSKDEKTLALGFNSHLTPNEIALFDLESNEESQITELNKEILNEIGVYEPELITFKNDDDIECEGWIIKPAAYEEGKKYPAILNIHGGPYLQFGWSYMFEFQLWASKGYAVMFCNPRGSRGYGQKFTNGIAPHFAQPAYEDIMKFVDVSIDTGIVDSLKMAVTGQSYGGYMTNWIITQTDRFKAAVPQSSVVNWMSMMGVSDLGYMTNELVLMDPVKDLMDLWDISPLKYAKNVKTPTLIIHSEEDYRCPEEQAIQFFTALKNNGADVELMCFPNSNHSLLRIGKPSFRIIRLDSILGYIDRYLR